MNKLKLKYYDKRKAILENYTFFKILIKTSRQGLLISFLFIGVLIGFDYLGRFILDTFTNSKLDFLNSLADIITKINLVVGIKFLDYFKDVIVIVAGVLGVILGLFFTTFLNIITSKYSNINSAIIQQLWEQKIINKYFKFLSILVSSAIIFQFLLIIGYHPTFISSSIFTLSVIITLLAFIFFGRYSLLYFNAGNLVSDVIDSNKNELVRAYRNKKFFNTNNNGYNLLQKILQNLNKVRIIVAESTSPQFSNTTIDGISDELLTFFLEYNKFKHTFPSNKGWHPKIQKHKRWDEATSTEVQMFSRIGAPLIPQTIDDYFNIEKELIETQFFIFNNTKEISKKVQLVFSQFKYVQTISFQCETELFDLFFNKLETLIKDNIKTTDENISENNLQLVSVYSNLLIQYLVGYNHNFERIVNSNNIKKLAKAIHYSEDIDSIMPFPYKIRIWLDNYQTKLGNEKYNEKTLVTPLFYTEFELAYQFQNLFKTHFENIALNIYSRVDAFSNFLKKSKMFLEAYEFLSETLDVYNKVLFFSGVIEAKIEKDIDNLNLKRESRFEFIERKSLLEKNTRFKKKALDEIWKLGFSSYSIKNKEFPDIFGNFYQLICEDILEKAFNNESDELPKYLPLFFTYNVLYIDSLKAKIDSKRFEYTASKLFPVLVDLFQISAITIILFKAFNNKKLEEAFFDFWDNAFEKDTQKEKDFWKLVFPIYEYFNQPLFGMSTPSYVREHKRKMRLEEFLKNSSVVRLEEKKGGFKSFMQHYVTDVEDIYFKDVVRRLSVDGFGGMSSDEISDIFIEYYLRTRIVLKELNIKETRYGSNLRRYMERDSE